DREVKVSSSIDGAYSLDIYTVVTELAKAKQYTPLTHFTITNTFCLHKEGHLLKKTKSSIDGTIHHLLDLLQFEAEEAMDALTWQEAWQHKISWLTKVAEPAIHECWSWHFSTLLKDEAIWDNFKAILSFNIRMRNFENSPPTRTIILPLAMSPMTHQLARIRNAHGAVRSPFRMAPLLLPTPRSGPTSCVSSVSTLVISSQNARRRLQ
ncbi:hypothetical protein PAXRUDRAFT_764473, partial [Paxillus rubicundulus Ve08.2h10]